MLAVYGGKRGPGRQKREGGEGQGGERSRMGPWYPATGGKPGIARPER